MATTKADAARVLAVAVAVWLLIDLVRVWAPSLITIFGQAAATPPELMGAYAFGCVCLAVVPLVLVRRGVLALPAAVLATVGLAAVCRVVVQAGDGGLAQLVAASVGVAAAIAGVCLVAPLLAGSVVPGLIAGIAIAAISHIFLGSYGAVWRTDLWGVGWLLVQLAGLLVTVRMALLAARSRSAGVVALPRALALCVLPALLLCGVTIGNPARASVAAAWFGPALLALASVAALACAMYLRAGRMLTALAGVVLIGAVAVMLLPAHTSGWALLAGAIGMPALAVVLSGMAPLRTVSRPPRPGSAVDGCYALFGGAIAWVLLLFAYYAGYDLGYRADAVLVALAVVLAVLGVLGAGRAGGAQPDRHQSGPRLARWLAAAIGAAAAAFAPLITITPVAWAQDGHEGLRVLAYNVRMGYGMDGTFDARGVAELIAAEDPDVVLLSEVDRAWLLNGGQDQLRILSRLLGLPAHFGPAADPVWGDAILTDLPARSGPSVPLPSFGAVTGAQALPAHLAFEGQEWTVISTHIQPHGGPDGSLDQARVLADLAAEYADGPLVLGGDLNLEPDTPGWDALLVGDLTDALAEARPLLTSPADAPATQIDHVLVSPGLTGIDAHAVGGELSDHLAVVVTLVPAP